MKFSDFVQRTACKEGLARTLAPIGAAFFAVKDLKSCVRNGPDAVAYAIATNSGASPTDVAVGAAVGMGIGTGVAVVSGAAIGYCATYGITNLSLAAIPSLKTRELPLLIKGVKPRLGLFSASCALFATTAIVNTLIDNHTTKRRIG